MVLPLDGGRVGRCQAFSFAGKYWTDEKKRAVAIPVRRLDAMEDIARLICFLAFDGASFITGEMVNISGGYHMD